MRYGRRSSSSWLYTTVVGLVLTLATAGGVRAFTANGSVIVQMFQWDWDSVAKECTEFLGPAGCGYVQVSPATEHVAGTAWWTDYQPVSYNLTSKRGTRAQYQNMVQTCHDAGVGVIADTVLNHMSGSSDGDETATGVGGTECSHYGYAGIYGEDDFHYCGTPDDALQDWTNRTQTLTCQMDNLADLKTESDHVREVQAAHVNDLISLGVDGLRLDSAKLMNASDIASLVSKLNSSMFITQEVTYSPGDAVLPVEYVDNGLVMEFNYTAALKDAFSSSNNGGVSHLKGMASWTGYLTSNQSNVFVADHDTERSGSSLNYTSPDNTYVLAHIFSLAFPYGTPTILSSYAFSEYSDAAPNNGSGTCANVTASSSSLDAMSAGWLCQHRLPAIAGMVHFYNSMAKHTSNLSSNNISSWTGDDSSEGGMRVAFSRGTAGFVAINNEDDEWSGSWDTQLGPASYCDVVQGAPSGTACAGQALVVAADGTLTATISGRSAIAVHIDGVGNG